MSNQNEEMKGLKNETSWQFEIDETRKKEALAEISLAVRKKKIRYYPSFASCMLEQMRYQTWQSRLIQGGILFLALMLCLVLRKEQTDDTTSIVLCSVFLAVASNLCLCTVGRLFSRNMAELEQTLYFNLKQMVCIQMLQAGLVDILILILLVAVCGGQNMAGAGACLLYLLVPFLWSNTVYLHMLTFLRGRGRGRNRARGLGRSPRGGMETGQDGIGTGVICGIAAVFPVFFEDAYASAYLPVWGLAALAGIAVLILEILRLLGKIEGGEGLCLN